jgi:Protein of unknown function (DUF2975)
MSDQKKKPSFAVTYYTLNLLLGLTVLITLVSISQPLLHHYGIKIETGPHLRVGLGPAVAGTISGTENSNPGYAIIGMEGNLIALQPDLGFSLISSIIPVLMWGSVSFGVLLLRGIVKNVFNGNHFAAENTRNTKVIAFMIILVPHIITILQNILLSSIPNKLFINGMEVYRMISAPIQIFDFVIMPDAIIAGLVVFVFAEIFNEGEEIKQENELTV